jgi:D-alanine--poly(phosphoribitol) ligase subunit 1
MSNLWDAFTSAAETGPQATSLLFANSPTSFAELKKLAETCAAALAARCVGQGDVVALQLTKRVETYALVLACLRQGAPYVFIDPKNPGARTERILERVRPRVLFTTSADGTNPFGAHVPLPSSQDARAWIDAWAEAGSAQRPPAPVTGADPAYIMFTSGSTGEPKGAVIPHQGVLGLMAWGRKTVGIRHGERLTGINPLHFDNSVFDLYCGLLNGATLVPIETAETTNPATWTRTIRNAQATIMFAVPTLFLILDRLGLLTPASLPDIKTFLFGGEGYPIARLRDFHDRFQERAKLINVYGPTETSCICASGEIDANALAGNDVFPPLGRMHENFSYTILDEGVAPAPPGGVGELWIGGPGVGLGYYAGAVETAARFRQDPLQDRYRAIYYRSGDLVREDEQGRLWFHGRVDNQVKLRGHRIELEEIDLAVQRIPGVRRAVTVVAPAPEGEELSVAFVADHTISPDEVHAACKASLPAYMRPTRVVQFDDLPCNANGKVDRAATKALLQNKTACR